jgi:hypothetical protein
MCNGRKDIRVCIHIRNILRARGCYRNVKVPSSPYKRGREGTCKRIQTFLGLVLLAEGFTVSLRSNLVLERVENSTRVWVVIRIVRVPPTAPVGLLPPVPAVRPSRRPSACCLPSPPSVGLLRCYKNRVDWVYPNPNPKIRVPAISGSNISGLISGIILHYPKLRVP